MGMWKLAVFKRKRPGFALVFTVLIALAMIIPVMILASSAITRRKAVVGESVSDRVLTVADATIDKILNKINTFNFTFQTPTMIDPDGNVDEATKKAQDFLVAHYLSEINGGVPDPSKPVDSLNKVKKNVSTYLFNFSNQHYYVVWDDTNNKPAAVSKVGPDGDITSGKIKDLNDGTIHNGISSIDSKYKKDNLWAEIDVRADYVSDEWVITDTAYLLSNPKIKRTIKAIAKKGQIVTSGGDFANGNWYTRSASDTSRTVYYSDFAGLYHTRVYFGKYETTKGPIRSDRDVYMGGWAQDPVYAHGSVYDYAIDDGWNRDGRFGPDRKRLWWARRNGYAVNGYPRANWPDGDKALFGSARYRDPTDPNGGLQDKADKDAGYYIDGDADIVFNNDGTVTITPAGGSSYTVPMPPNGAIFVSGNATVSGTVKGRCTVGAGENIYIGGNILYNNPPRTDKDTPIPPGYTPDSLGLIAHNNIVIPVSTFNSHHHLEIDAAMLAVNGWFGIGSGYSWHRMTGSGEYEAWWNGCQAVYSGGNAPAISDGYGDVKGYDIQHTNYDWNLYDYGAPPFYPATNTRTEAQHTVRYLIVTDADTLNYLRSLTKDELTPIDPSASDYDPNYPYKYVYNGVTYYYGTHFNYGGAVARMNSTRLYRLSWKEQIGEPVVPTP